MKSSITSLRTIGLSLVLSALPQLLYADPFLFNTDDLLLGVQATSGTGTNHNVFFNLGNTVDIKNTPNQGVVGNIAADLSAAFGTGWFSRAEVVFGVIGNRSNLAPNIEPGVPPQEPGRTMYVSRAASSPGTAGLRSAFGSGTLGTGGTNFLGIKNYLVISAPPTSNESFTATASGATVLDSIIHPVSWNNSWTKWNPSGGAASFGIFTGGIQNSFGTGSEVFVDVQRMVAGTPTTYVATVGIASNGDVRVFSASAATPYTTWIERTFAGGTLAPADRDPGHDPDKDGIENSLEFVLNGDPTVNSQSILPTLDASGSNFEFNFIRRADSAGEATQVFEYSTDLVDWTTKAPVTIPTTSGTSGFVTVGASTGTSPNQVQAVTLTIPKAAETKLFGRLKVVK